VDPKGNVFLNRYIQLAHAIHGGRLPDQTAGPTTMTIRELASLWDCSERAAQESVQRLEQWGLLRWSPQAGRGRRSDLALLVHPVHVYFEQAERALGHGALAEAGFWLNEVMRECPCIPAAATMLTEIRQQLGLGDLERCCNTGWLEMSMAP
jgi:MarR-like DNA-binding transcriptional regulator SgrR of sgrS sRNA